MGANGKKAWQKGLDRMPQAVGEFPVDGQNMALLVIDMQYYVAHSDYGVLKNYVEWDPEAARYYADRLKIVVPNCAKLIAFFRKNKMRVFYGAFGASLLDGSDLHPLRQMRLKEIPAFTTEDFEFKILEELKPQRGELVIPKATRSAFSGTSLDHRMRMAGIDTIVTVGAATDVCVGSTARGAWDLGYKVILIDDATATFTEEDQIYTMRNWAAFFGKVMDT
ncbi:MAG: isochorismatase family cysteine hydrolase, partial [Desulfatiglandales bacterium]